MYDAWFLILTSGYPSWAAYMVEDPSGSTVTPNVAVLTV